MSDAVWFYALDDVECGPVSLPQLRGLFAAKTLDGDDLVWTEGMEDWLPAAQVPGLIRQESPAATAKARSTSPGSTSPGSTSPGSTSPGSTSPGSTSARGQRFGVEHLQSPQAPPEASTAAQPAIQAPPAVQASPAVPVAPTVVAPPAATASCAPHLADQVSISHRAVRQATSDATTPNGSSTRSIGAPAPHALLPTLPIRRVVLGVGLLLILTAQGCELLGHRYVQRLRALDQIARSPLAADANIGQDTDPAISKRADTRVGQRAVGDAEAQQQAWSYCRGLLLVSGTLVFAVGLMAVALAADGAERWACWLILAVLVFCVLGGGSIWSTSPGG